MRIEKMTTDPKNLFELIDDGVQSIALSLKNGDQYTISEISEGDNAYLGIRSSAGALAIRPSAANDVVVSTVSKLEKQW